MSAPILHPYDPEVRSRVEKMRRIHAEERADRLAAESICTLDRCNRLAAEAMRLRSENVRLMEALQAVQGWPVRLLLPYRGEVAA